MPKFCHNAQPTHGSYILSKHFFLIKNREEPQPLSRVQSIRSYTMWFHNLNDRQHNSEEGKIRSELQR